MVGSNVHSSNVGDMAMNEELKEEVENSQEESVEEEDYPSLSDKIVELALAPYRFVEEAAKKLSFFGLAEIVRVHVVATLILTVMLVVTALYQLAADKLSFFDGFVPLLSVFLALLISAGGLYLLSREKPLKYFEDEKFVEVEGELQLVEEIEEEEEEEEEEPEDKNNLTVLLLDDEEEEPSWDSQEFDLEEPDEITETPATQINLESLLDDIGKGQGVGSGIRNQSFGNLEKYMDNEEEDFSASMDALRAEEAALTEANEQELFMKLEELVKGLGGE